MLVSSITIYKSTSLKFLDIRTMLSTISHNNIDMTNLNQFNLDLPLPMMINTNNFIELSHRHDKLAILLRFHLSY